MAETQAQEICEWALDTLQKHPVTAYVGEAKAFQLAIQLAEVRTDFEIRLNAAFGREPVREA